MPGADTGGRFRYLDTQEIYRGHVIEVQRVRFAAPDGTEMIRDVVRHPGAVAVVPLLESGEVVLVRQFRAPFGTDVLEIPAGKLDVAGEDLAAAAQRELGEEVGLYAAKLEPLVRFHNSVGFSDEESHVFLATGLTEVPRDRQGPEELNMVEVRMALSDMTRAIAAGEITDAKTVLGLMAAMDRVREGG
jgi:ADP-ribose pyrophosphatase